MNRLFTHNQSLSCFLLLCGLFLTGCAGSSAARWNDITVSNMHGQQVQPLAQTGEHAATVLIFITDDCPISNSYAPQINSLVTDFTPRGVSFFLVQVDPMLTDAEAQKHAADFSFTCPVLMDREHLLVKAANAGVTPEAAVISSSNEIAYRGRIDDRNMAQDCWHYPTRRRTPRNRDAEYEEQDTSQHAHASSGAAGA
jgi:hypothetical protein